MKRKAKPRPLTKRQEALVLEHRWLVVHLVRRKYGRLMQRQDVEDLEQVGTIGLIEAARRFDPKRGVKFTSFALSRIMGAVLDQIRRDMGRNRKWRVAQVTGCGDALRWIDGLRHCDIAARYGLCESSIDKALCPLRHEALALLRHDAQEIVA